MKHNPDWKTLLEKTVISSAKIALGQQQAQDIADSRQKVMAQITQDTASKVQSLLGIKVINVQMPNFTFDRGYVKAMEVAAEEKTVLRRKQIELQQQEVTAQTTVVNADAAAKAQEATADAQAYTKLKNKEAQAQGDLAILQAQAKGFNDVAKAIGVENMQTYLVTNKWDGNGQIVPQVQAGKGGAMIVPNMKLATLGK